MKDYPYDIPTNETALAPRPRMASVWRVVVQHPASGHYYVEAPTDDAAAARFERWWNEQPHPATEGWSSLVLSVTPVSEHR